MVCDSEDVFDAWFVPLVLWANLASRRKVSASMYPVDRFFVGACFWVEPVGKAAIDTIPGGVWVQATLRKTRMKLDAC